MSEVKLANLSKYEKIYRDTAAAFIIRPSLILHEFQG